MYLVNLKAAWPAYILFNASLLRAYFSTNLPLCPLDDSNDLPVVYKTTALPIELNGLYIKYKLNERT